MICSCEICCALPHRFLSSSGAGNGSPSTWGSTGGEGERRGSRVMVPACLYQHPGPSSPWRNSWKNSWRRHVLVGRGLSCSWSLLGSIRNVACLPQKESEVGKGSGEDTGRLKKLFSGHPSLSRRGLIRMEGRHLRRAMAEENKSLSGMGRVGRESMYLCLHKNYRAAAETSKTQNKQEEVFLPRYN